MKTRDFQHQCDFCLNIIYCPKIKKKKNGYGFENHICPKCLKNEFGLVWKDSEFEDFMEEE